MNNRATFIISKGFRTYLIAMLITLVAEQLCASMNMVLVGHFLGPMPFAALDLAIPVENIATGLILLMVSGCAIPASRYLGNQEFGKARRIISVAFVFTAFATVAMSVLFNIYLEKITGYLCMNNPDLFNDLYIYMRIFSYEWLPMSMARIMIIIASFYSNPMRIALASGIAAAIDVLIDVILMYFFQMGVEVVAYSDVAAYIIQALILLPVVTNRKTSFRFELPGKSFFALVKENLYHGTSYVIPYVTMAVFTVIANSLVLNKLGSDALFLWSAAFQVLSIVIMAMDYLGGTMLLIIGGTMAGCGDMSGLLYITRQCAKASLLILLPIMILSLIYPQAILIIFGGGYMTQDPDALMAIRCLVLFNLPMNFLLLKFYLHQTLEDSTQASITYFSLMGISLVAMVLTSFTHPQHMFAAFTLAGLGIMILDAIGSILYSRRHKKENGYYLIPKEDNSDFFMESVPYTIEGRDIVIRNIAEYMESRNIDPGITNSVNICCEEIVMNLVNKNMGIKDKEYMFDVCIRNLEDSVKVSIKDAGEPFNPIKEYNKSAAESYAEGEDVDISLLLVNVMCKDIEYNYMLGQNTILMNFTKQQAPVPAAL